MDKEFLIGKRIDLILENFDENIPEGWTDDFLRDFSRKKKQLFLNNKKFLAKQNLEDYPKSELLKTFWEKIQDKRV